MPDYAAAVVELLAIPHPVALGPGAPNESLHAKLEAVAKTLPPACAAGLWLRFDFLDESHAISQDLHTVEGHFWHAIMHRREPDASNSKYWWRKVGSHPVISQLVEESPALGYDFTKPLMFVDFCERVRGTDTASEAIAKQVQLLEWQLLFDYCYRNAHS